MSDKCFSFHLCGPSTTVAPLSYCHTLTGIIALALALRPGGNFSDFKRAFVEEIKASIEVRHSAVLPATHPWTRHRDALLSVLLPLTDPRQVSLRLLLTGDLQSDTIAWHRPGGASDEDIVAYANLLADKLMPIAPEVFSRTRWMGSVTPLEQIALPANAHNLLSRAILRWQGKASGAGGNCQGVRLSDEFGPVLSDPEEIPSREADNADQDQPENAPQPTMPGASTGTVGPNDWTAWNAKQLRDTVKFAQSVGQVILLVAFIALRPLVALQRSVEYIDSEAWEQQQMHRVVTGQPFKPRLVHIASLAQTDKFFQDVEELLGPDPRWDVLPKSGQTVQNLNIAAGMLMTMMCGISQLMRWSHAGFPVRLFRLLREPSLAHDILHACHKLRDSFAEAFLRTWSTVPLLKSVACRLELFLILVLARKTIARIECRHASIKRRIGRRTSAKKEAFLDTSSAFLLMRQRLLENAQHRRPAHDKRDTAAQAQAWTRKTREKGKFAGKPCGGGGLQRAAFSELLKRLGGGGELSNEERRDVFLTAHR